jgi:hypothetical protein
MPQANVAAAHERAIGRAEAVVTRLRTRAVSQPTFEAHARLSEAEHHLALLHAGPALAGQDACPDRPRN